MIGMESKSAVREPKIYIVLVGAPDEALTSQAFQKELSEFYRALQFGGLEASSRHFAFDAIHGGGGLSGEFGILVSTLGPAVFGAVGGAVIAYLKGRQERKCKLRVGLDGVIEAEAQTLEEVEKLVAKGEEIWRRNQPKVIDEP